MSDNQGRPTKPVGERDPVMFTALVEFKLKHNTERKEIIRQLIDKGLSHGQASALVDTVETRQAKLLTMSAVTPLVVARTVAAGLFAALVAVLVWDQYLTGVARPAGYVLTGVLTGAGIVLGAWGRKSAAFQAIAGAIALAALAFGAYNACELKEISLLDTIREFSLQHSLISDCLKNNLFEKYDIAWAAGSLVACWLIARKQWIRLTL